MFCTQKKVQHRPYNLYLPWQILQQVHQEIIQILIHCGSQETGYLTYSLEQTFCVYFLWLFLWYIFTLRKNPYNIRNICLFGSENPRSVRFGVDAIAFPASQLWQKVPIAIKGSSSLETFKAKIKLWSCGDWPCNLCIKFIANVGYIYIIYCIFFAFNFSQCLLVRKLLWFLSTLNKEMYVYMYVCM